MSGINGDKARFHKDRKSKIARRKRTRELLNLGAQPKTTTAGSGSKPRAVKV
jgi:hypothetical protein